MSLADVATEVAEALLEDSGSNWTYSRGATRATISLYKSDQPPIAIDQGSGLIVEVIQTSFRGLVSSFADFGNPKQGDKITDGASTYEVRPVADKCYYTIGGLIHIHAVQVSG